jgi:hypothetical protein
MGTLTNGVKMSNFWDVLQTSALTQAIITIMVLGADITLMVQGRPIPDFFTAISSLVIGFYFGSKVGIYQANRANANALKGK